MNLESLNNWILPFVMTISVVIVTILYSFSKLREMNAIQAKELITTLKEEVVVQKGKVDRLTEENRTLRDSHQLQLNELNKQIGILNGRMAELSKQNETLTKILQGKNPEQERFMKLLTEAATVSNQTQEDAKKYMEDTQKVLKEISSFMRDLHDRNIRVDKLAQKKR